MDTEKSQFHKNHKIIKLLHHTLFTHQFDKYMKDVKKTTKKLIAFGPIIQSKISFIKEKSGLSNETAIFINAINHLYDLTVTKYGKN